MALGYFCIFLTIFGAAGIAFVLLKLARGIWKRARFRVLAAVPLLLGGFCAFAAVYLLEMLLREGFYSF